MSILFIAKLVIVVIFLGMFIRRPSPAWGVGLLTVTTAVLLDTLFGTLNRELIEGDLGFFYFVIAGLLVGGMAFWLLGVLWPLLPGWPQRGKAAAPAKATTPEARSEPAPAQPLAFTGSSGTADGVDRRMLYDDLRTRFGREDVYDLIYDMGISENSVIEPGATLEVVLVNVLDEAEQTGQTAALALAVERILTPPPPEHLPRLAKLSPDSPPAVLRQYLQVHYSLADLAQASRDLGVDWDSLEGTAKQAKGRNLLLYLARRNRTADIVDWIQAHPPHGEQMPPADA